MIDKLTTLRGWGKIGNLYKAYELATEAHAGQLRRGGADYITHPFIVATYVYKYTDGDREMSAAAMLHDTIEDTYVTYEYIKDNFNERIANLVLELTIDKEEASKVTKKVYLTDSMNNMSKDALLIKLCDRYHNIGDMVNVDDSKFIIWYYEQTDYIIHHLNRNVENTHFILIDKIMDTLSEIKKLYSL